MSVSVLWVAVTAVAARGKYSAEGNLILNFLEFSLCRNVGLGLEHDLQIGCSLQHTHTHHI